MSKLFGFLTVLVLGLTVIPEARASYFLWQVDSEYSNVAEVWSEYNAARLVYDDGTGNRTSVEAKILNDDTWVHDINGKGDGTKNSVVDVVKDGGDVASYEVAVELTGLTGAGYTFYIELLNYTSATEYTVAGNSQGFTYAQLEAGHYVGDDTTLTPILPADIWHGDSYSVPEPASSMLVLFALGVLGLKRRIREVC